MVRLLSSRLSETIIGVAVILGVATAPGWSQERIKLNQLNIEKGSLTVSGISSGGYMAHQFHIAYSLTVNGAGIIAGGPFHCAAGTDAGDSSPDLPPLVSPYLGNREVVTFYNALCRCMSVRGGEPEVDRLYQSISQMAMATDPEDYGVLGPKIDNPKGLDGDKVFILAGRQDLTVDPRVGHALEQLYSKLADGAKAKLSIRTEYEIEASHAFPVMESEGPNNCSRQCKVGNTPFCQLYFNPLAFNAGESVCNYINDCDYDTPGVLFRDFYGAAEPGKEIIENLYEFDQSEFIRLVQADRYDQISLASYGHIYVPTACKGGASCKLHVAFHGCGQGGDDVASQYPRQTGYNRWAENNNIVVLYPRVKPYSSPTYSLAAMVTWKSTNPAGCWDWWGYTNGTTYDTKKGPQMLAVKCMVDRVRGEGIGECLSRVSIKGIDH